MPDELEVEIQACMPFEVEINSSGAMTFELPWQSMSGADEDVELLLDATLEQPVEMLQSAEMSVSLSNPPVRAELLTYGGQVVTYEGEPVYVLIED